MNRRLTNREDRMASQNAQHDRRIDYIELSATSIPEIRTFYTKAFGWKFTDYGPEYTSFEDGRLAGGFHAGGPTGGNGVLVVIYAVDLAEAEKRVRDAGGTVVKPVFEFPGGRRFHFQDPSGNELAVWSDN